MEIFICKKCVGETFSTKSHLNAHISLKHSKEGGKRECIKCASVFSQMNNFVVHYKKKHLKKNCSELCNAKSLCTLCDLDLKSAKIEWQLKPLEVESPAFERVGGHTCSFCKISFGEKYHLNAHIKLKHDESQHSGVCTDIQCSSSFAQINNFVVHFKKRHINCVCDSKKLCDKCKETVAQAKKLWLDNKSKAYKDAKSAESATVLSQSSLAALIPTSITAVKVTSNNSIVCSKIRRTSLSKSGNDASHNLISGVVAADKTAPIKEGKHITQNDPTIQNETYRNSVTGHESVSMESIGQIEKKDCTSDDSFGHRKIH